MSSSDTLSFCFQQAELLNFCLFELSAQTSSRTKYQQLSGKLNLPLFLRHSISSRLLLRATDCILAFLFVPLPCCAVLPVVNPSCAASSYFAGLAEDISFNLFVYSVVEICTLFCIFGIVVFVCVLSKINMWTQKETVPKS